MTFCEQTRSIFTESCRHSEPERHGGCGGFPGHLVRGVELGNHEAMKAAAKPVHGFMDSFLSSAEFIRNAAIQSGRGSRPSTRDRCQRRFPRRNKSPGRG